MKRSALKPKSVATCQHCGKEYRRPPSRIGKYCSHPCAAAAGALAKGPQHRRKYKERKCAICGKSFYPQQVNVVRGGGRYCSRACFHADPTVDRSRNVESVRAVGQGRLGSKNPNYKHGRRAEVWHRRFNLKLKGEDCCRNCGADYTLHLHHAIPRSKSREARDKLLNGVPLCPKCHLGWHRKCVVLYRDIFTAEEWAYLSSVELVGERIEAWLDDHYPDRGRPFRKLERSDESEAA